MKDFLLNPATGSGWVMESVRLDPASTQFKLAETCLALLGQDTTSSEYALLHWMDHMKQCGDFAQVLLEQNDGFFGIVSETRSRW